MTDSYFSQEAIAGAWEKLTSESMVLEVALALTHNAVSMTPDHVVRVEISPDHVAQLNDGDYAAAFDEMWERLVIPQVTRYLIDIGKAHKSVLRKIESGAR